MDIDFLFEDRELLVCRKPAGIPVQSARIGQKDMVSILKNDRMQDVYVVHRLDQPVEGVLVFAKTKRAAAGLSRQISDGGMKKIYQAVCCTAGDGQLRDPGSGRRESLRVGSTHCLTDHLVKDGRTNTSSVAKPGDRNAKRAELTFKVLSEPVQGRYLLIEIELKTGRHHQIRVQMAHAGLPLYGDRKYNADWKEYLLQPADSGQPGLPDGPQAQTGLALCAVSLSFDHPATGKRMTFSTEPRAEIFRIVRPG